MAGSSEEPAMLALNILFEKIVALQEELKEAENAVRNQAAPHQGDHDDGEEVNVASRKIRKEYNHLTKEISLLKKSVPEGLPEDEEFQYSVAVAEMHRNMEELKGFVSVSERNLHSVLDQVQLTQNLILDAEKMNESFSQKISSRTARDRHAPKKKPVSDQEKQVDQKLRSTKMEYKELKTFLGGLLEDMVLIDHDSKYQGPHLLGQLIQSLWYVFQQEGPDAYLKLSGTEHGVDQADIVWLVSYGIAEADSLDKDRLRLINFTV